MHETEIRWAELIKNVVEATGWTLDQILELTAEELQVLNGIDPARRVMRLRG